MLFAFRLGVGQLLLHWLGFLLGFSRTLLLGKLFLSLQVLFELLSKEVEHIVVSVLNLGYHISVLIHFLDLCQNWRTLVLVGHWLLLFVFLVLLFFFLLVSLLLLLFLVLALVLVGLVFVSLIIVI